MDPTIVIHMNVGSKKPPEVVGQTVVTFKEFKKGAKDQVPAAILEFRTSCSAEVNCNKGSFNTTFYVDSDKEFLSKYIAPHRH
jgi:hypothetical protein